MISKYSLEDANTHASLIIDVLDIFLKLTCLLLKANGKRQNYKPRWKAKFRAC